VRGRNRTIESVLLVPSARLVPVELQAEFGRIPPALIPLDAKPALHYIVAPYARAGYRTVVAVDEEREQVERYVARRPELGATTFAVGPTGSLAETLLTTLEELELEPPRVVVNFADTVVTDPLPERGTVIACRPVSDAYRWTTLRASTGGRIDGIVDKDREKPGPPPHRALVGVFAFHDAPGLRAALRRAVEAPRHPEVDPFYDALWELSNELPAGDRSIVDVEGWFDLGHLDTYYDTKRGFFLGRRFFNDVRVDTRRGAIRKTSGDAGTLNREIAWYLKLPLDLQHVAPRVFDFRIDERDPYLEIEFYGYPTLADTYLFGRADPGVWTGILDALGALLDDLHGVRLENATREELCAAVREMYERKTLERLRAVEGDDRFGALLGDQIRINGRPCLGLAAVRDWFDDAARLVGLFEVDAFTVVHGDLCASNVLYDRRNRLLRVIDPRGRFGSFDVHGDPAYDLAKLAHSFEGDYDLLLGGLFDWEMDGIDVRLVPWRTGEQREIRRRFARFLADRCGDGTARVRLIESLLFLSMLPLHADRPRSQLAFLARGLELFSRVLEEARARATTPREIPE